MEFEFGFLVFCLASLNGDGESSQHVFGLSCEMQVTNR